MEINGYEVGPGADLDGADLTGADLRRVAFIGATLESANLENTNLEEVNLIGVNLRGVGPLKLPLGRNLLPKLLIKTAQKQHNRQPRDLFRHPLKHLLFP